MPARDPFTQVCRQLARGRYVGRADLHLHTNCSDGTYSPAEIADVARRSGLAAIAVTDHDTTAGVNATREAARDALEVIAGVEITTEHHGRELHLLGYYIDLEYEPLQTALRDICHSRVQRFSAMIERLRGCGVSIDEREIGSPDSLGRRHLAELLVRQGKAGSLREAFVRWLADGRLAEVPKKRLPVAEAIDLVRRAGGVAAWAHPAYDGTVETLAELARLGLGAIEVEFPEVKRSRSRELRSWAEALGLAVTGGSDCHGPGPRSVGRWTISDSELDLLRHATRGNPCSAPSSTRSN
jgi:predicted metal-dependent phosphoesterase TrpH